VININGHNMAEILDAFVTANQACGKPTIIIAKTIKGKGVSFMENDCDWHGIPPNTVQYIKSMHELGFDLNDPKVDKNGLLKQVLRKINANQRESLSKPETVSLELKPVSTRDAYGEVLVELGEEFQNLVVFEADISKSTRTRLFAEKFPNRFYQFGIAEADIPVRGPADLA